MRCPYFASTFASDNGTLITDSRYFTGPNAPTTTNSSHLGQFAIFGFLSLCGTVRITTEYPVNSERARRSKSPVRVFVEKPCGQEQEVIHYVLPGYPCRPVGGQIPKTPRRHQR